MNRRVAQIEPKRESQGQDSPRILDYVDRELIILLGDPGAGKTHSFEMMASFERAPIYSVQTFIARNGDKQAGTVYLDGLEEYRPQAGSYGPNPAITLLQILRSNGHPRLRVSCRFADWLGSADLKLFKDYCQAGQHAVLALELLNKEEAIDILAVQGFPDPESFLGEAAARRMQWTITNPQSLLMLANVVVGSGWPEGRKDLYEQWTLRQLGEHNENLLHSRLGGYSPEDLVDPAGATCTTMLISGVTGIQRTSTSSDRVPSYRTIPCSEPDRVLAALGRRAFSSAEPNVATYVHRTIAEYLGARWLGTRVAAGLPLSRIQALIGVDGHPSPSLRGLHAWLPLFVPLQASQLISRDPLGVLTYGDTASLQPSQKHDLIECLGTLAAENAWFLDDGPSDFGLVGLSCPETADQLIGILRSGSNRAPLKTLALHAIAVGEPLACYFSHLEQILADVGASPRHRLLAFKALLKFGTEGTAAITRIYAEVIRGESQLLGLRSAIVVALYGQPLGPADVVAILADAAARSESNVSGEFWPLCLGIKTPDLLAVLEEFGRQSDAGGPLKRTLPAEVSACVERMIGRLCEGIADDDRRDIERLLKILREIYEKRFGTPTGFVHLDRILAQRPRLLWNLVDLAICQIAQFDDPVNAGLTLNRLTSGAVTIELVAERILPELEGCSGMPFPAEMLEKYEALGRFLFSGTAEAANTFERFMKVAKGHPECEVLLKRYTTCEVDEARWRPRPFDEHLAEYRNEVRLAVEADISALQRGEKPDLQGKLALIYFGIQGATKNVTRMQLVLAIGDPLTEAVEQGFIAAVEIQPPPALSDIAEISATDRTSYYWYAFLAGMDLLWKKTKDVGQLPPDTLAAAFACSLLLNTFDEEGKPFPGISREWSRRILGDRPEVAEEACATLLAERLRRKREIKSLLQRLPDAAAAPWRSKLGLRFLLDYELTETADLQELFLMAGASPSERQGLAAAARARPLAAPASCSTADLMWILVGFLLLGEEFQPQFSVAASGHCETLWVLKYLTEFAAHVDSTNPRFELSLYHMEIVIRAFGPVFKNVPRGADDWEDRSDHEAALFIGGLVTAISIRPDSAAGECLARLLGCEDLASYHPWIGRRLVDQREVNRRSRYQSPAWGDVCAALGGGPPANIEDLKALFLETLADAAQDIRHSNSDKYRVYWRGDKAGSDSPRGEDYCRDRLVDYARGRLSPLNLWVEPEGHMAADKRADIVVLGPGRMKLPVEVKRDTHVDLWIAARNQLERLYTRDPNAQGYGIYLVFYFGPGRGRGITPRPDGPALGDSPDDLLMALNATVPSVHRDRITCVVIDLSPPALPRSKELKSKVRGRRAHI